MPLPLGIVIYTTVSLLGGVLLPDQAMLTLDHLQQVWQFNGNKLISCNKELGMRDARFYLLLSDKPFGKGFQDPGFPEQVKMCRNLMIFEEV